jgi:hypothetical protein
MESVVRYPRGKARLISVWPAEKGDQSGGFEQRATLIAMPVPAPFLSHLNLAFALLWRWLGLWTGAKPPTRFVRVLERTERDLAAAIRATLRADGVAFPDLADAALLQWFARHPPCSDKPTLAAVAARRHRNRAVKPLFNAIAPLDRRLPAGQRWAVSNAGGNPAPPHARGPP